MSKHQKSEVSASVKIEALFPQHIVVLGWENVGAMNERLTDLIKSKSNEPGLHISNMHGWHSKKDLLNWSGEDVGRLKDLIRSALVQATLAYFEDAPTLDPDAWEVLAWANVNPANAANLSHNHAANQSCLSGVYYVKVPLEDSASASGEIVFEDHSGFPTALDKNISRRSGREHAITPQEGTMVVFPSWLYHRVNAHQNDTDRISIAFNARHPQLEVYRYDGMADLNWRWQNFRGVMRLVKWGQGLFKRKSA